MCSLLQLIFLKLLVKNTWKNEWGDLNNILRDTTILDQMAYAQNGNPIFDKYPTDKMQGQFLTFDWVTTQIEYINNSTDFDDSYLIARLTTHTNGVATDQGKYKFRGFAAMRTTLQNTDKTYDIGITNELASSYDNKSIVPLIEKNINKILRDAPKSGILVTVSNYKPSSDNTSAIMDLEFTNVYVPNKDSGGILSTSGVTFTGFNNTSADDNNILTQWYLWVPIASVIIIIAIIVAVIINHKKREKETSELKGLIRQQGGLSRKLSASNNSVKQLGGPTGPMPGPGPGPRGPAPGPSGPAPRSIGGPAPRGPMPGPAPRGPAPGPRPMGGPAPRGSGPMPPRVEVNAPPKSLAPKRK